MTEVGKVDDGPPGPLAPLAAQQLLALEDKPRGTATSSGAPTHQELLLGERKALQGVTDQPISFGPVPMGLDSILTPASESSLVGSWWAESAPFLNDLLIEDVLEESPKPVIEILQLPTPLPPPTTRQRGPSAYVRDPSPLPQHPLVPYGVRPSQQAVPGWDSRGVWPAYPGGFRGEPARHAQFSGPPVSRYGPFLERDPPNALKNPWLVRLLLEGLVWFVGFFLGLCASHWVLPCVTFEPGRRPY